MGLCHSSHKKHRIHEHEAGEPDDSLLRPLKDKTKRSYYEKGQDATETETETGTDNTDLDTTLPLSPDSIPSQKSPSLASINSISKARKHLPDDSPGGDQPPLPLDSTPPSFKVQHSFETSKNTRKGRALQARLKKARMRQIALSPETDANSNNNNNGSNHNNNNPCPVTASDNDSFSSFLEGDDDETDDDSLGGLPSIRFTLSQETSRSRRNNSLNEEFEATMNKGMIWAEVDNEDKVSAVALSRQTPTLEQSTPPLFLAVGSQDGRVAVTELLEGGPFASGGARLGTTLYRECKGRVRTLDFSPDGQILVVAGDDGVCTLLNPTINQDLHLDKLTTLQEIRRSDRIYAVQFSPDGCYLAIGGYDDSVAIVSLPTPSTAEIVAEIPTEGLVLSLDWSPDGNLLAIGGSDKRCLIVNTQNKDYCSIAYEVQRSSSIQTVQWHPKTGRYLAIGASDVAILDRETFQIRHEIGVNGRLSNKTRKSNDIFWNIGQTKSHDAIVYRIHHLCWSPTGGYLVVNSSDGLCKILETKSYSPIQDIQRSGQITSIVWGQHSVIAGIPHRYLAMGGDDQKVVILKAGIEISAGTSSIGDDISSSAGSFLSNRGDWVLKENIFRDVDEGNLTTMSVTHNPKQAGGYVHALAFSRGSKGRPSAFFALATGDGMVTVRSTLGWKIMAQLEFLFPTTSLAFSNGSRLLALGGQDGKIRIVATSPSWTVIHEINAEASVNSMTFSKNNERLVVGTSDGTLLFLNPQENFSVSWECEESESPVLTVDWCTRYLACGREDGTLAIYESDKIFESRFAPASLVEGTKPLCAVAFGGGSKFLVCAADDGSISVYSAAGDWALMHELNAGFPVTCMKWSPNGRHLAFAGANNKFKIMDTVFWADVEEANRMEQAPVEGGKSRYPSFLSFSQEGRFLAHVCGKSGTRVMNTTSWDTILKLQTDLSEDSDHSDISSPTGSMTE